MRERLDPLIAERAPWLFGDHFYSRPSRQVLTRLLGYGRTLALAEHFRDRSTEEIMSTMGDLLARDVEVQGLERIPRNGPALIVANHPTGIADGIVLHHLIAPLRPDLFVYANSDILRVLPQMESLIAAVEWRPEKRSRAKTRETMDYTRRALEAGRLGIIFPAGRLAKRRGLRLFERDWMTSAAMIARKFDLPVIPVNIRARNSVLFYLFDLLHPTLRDITLFHETLNKSRQPYRVNVGAPISAEALPARSEDGIEALRQATLRLGGRHAPTVSLVDVTRRPAFARRLGLPTG
ncbi:lysophospholipid acyltransferase family protein [Roseitranquillus sediminis]|uniref:lysophospholipid acyltransferase family protein n=1 Tax=Roseitranquillus sediminis TaxID=2809051 RepID=UPI001D0C9E20|nr:lysophospholipid acyltransferase family protein [Roseitranquillus sediminis]MBM9595365.1 lysophospholipid acyltransferase family protein [Roseitranquillus sediminis]